MEKVVVCWFRRDLRVDDQHAFLMALKSGFPVLPLFVFDKNILDKLENRSDARVSFIHQRITQLDKKFRDWGSAFHCFYGTPEQAFDHLLEAYDVQEVYCNHDYEQYALQRDKDISNQLNKKGIPFHSFKDQCIFERLEVSKDDGKPYTVFTPYKNKWLQKLQKENYEAYSCDAARNNLIKVSVAPKGFKILSLQEMNFKESTILVADAEYKSVLSDYADKRNFPAIKGTSRVSVHLRFGTVSIRQLLRDAMGKSDVWVSELIWRDFYFMILSNFPHVQESSFKPNYDRIRWRNNEDEFKRWCEGTTGYPIVDAGMRELNETGFMHNRVRMIVASFLTKHLLIDWRWGADYFAQHLLDFELSSNNGGWQWASGSGCDAAPYFRIFSPSEQTKKFDPELKYIRKWVPEFQSLEYAAPIVDHKFARERCLAVYKEALQ